ncbi:hypothetical protein MDOR_11050 [Mycolicibacterium doricum]|uniref:Uncharacterized protein n=1 Tax=Mycolicibacterium doricum TaxID=126673 RepID=A0A7I7VNS4_9MYCO|nr:hypothetical protein [Mycolicibacterium doricum]MCV7268677.1 hypothetical protein [Mycolicibacterium doricum]BBZ06936.1 hypothetical protein MDOR_11050 [Mycolicibacterium doricum]
MREKCYPKFGVGAVRMVRATGTPIAAVARDVVPWTSAALVVSGAPRVRR